MILEAICFPHYYRASLNFERENIIIFFVVYERVKINELVIF